MKKIKKKTNNFFDMHELMKKFGYIEYGTTCFCPFHDDRGGGKRSGKIYTDTNTLYCFSEQRVYTPYDLLQLEGYTALEIAEKVPDDVPDNQYNKKQPLDLSPMDEIASQWKYDDIELDDLLKDLLTLLLEE